MASRARNLVHRSGVLGIVGGVTFAVAFGLLLWFTRVERAALQRVPAPADTVDLARQASSLRRQQFRADSALAESPPPRRVLALTRAPVRIDPSITFASADSNIPDSVTVSATPGASSAAAVADVGLPVVAMPDSVRAAVSALTMRLQRAQNAPLATSWRALAADPLLQQDPRVRALADSLADAERARNEYDAVGGVDPVYLELSSRVTAFGRAIERIAQQRIASALRPYATGGQVAMRLGPSSPELARRFSADSARHEAARAKRDAAARRSDSVSQVLTTRRAEALARDSARARAQRRVDALAPPLAMLTASAVAAIGVALFVTLLIEVRSPRLADEQEVAAQAGLPVLLSVRLTDAMRPDALTSAFSQLVFDLEPALSTTRSLIVLGDDWELATRTAARIAERLGAEGRSARVVSVQQATPRMAPRTTPRTTRGRVTPANALAVLVHPERTQGVAWTGEFSRHELGEDAITLRAGTLEEVRSALVSSDTTAHVVLVVRTGSTPSAWLERARSDTQRIRGRDALGVVIWAPDIEDSDPVSYAYGSALQHGREPISASVS